MWGAPTGSTRLAVCAVQQLLLAAVGGGGCAGPVRARAWNLACGLARDMHAFGRACMYCRAELAAAAAL